MEAKQFEKLQARILLKYVSEGDRDGREIAYLYNRESFDTLNIEKQDFDDSQFISIGDIIELEGYKCKVVEINFKLESQLYKMNPNVGINLLSPTDPSDYNCQIGVFVERIEE